MKKTELLEHKLRPGIEIEQKSSYSLEEVLKIVNEIDGVWEKLIDGVSPEQNFLQFYVS